MTAMSHSIGDFEFCDPDYRQILLWAGALKLDPVVVIERLESSFVFDRKGVKLEFAVQDGAIVSLTWDFDLLPLSEFEWVDGLVIRELGFKTPPAAPPALSLRLPELVWLQCPDINLTVLELSNIPKLVKLVCAENHLHDLDLSKVPQLTHL